MGSGREELHAIVERGLRQAIHDHGPITTERASSAAKRIAGQIVNARLDTAADKAANERLHKKLAELRHGHARALDENRRLRERLAENETPDVLAQVGTDGRDA